MFSNRAYFYWMEKSARSGTAYENMLIPFVKDVRSRVMADLLIFTTSVK